MERSIVYRDLKWNHGVLYPWVQLSSDRDWEIYSPQEVPEEEIKIIMWLERNVQQEMNRILSKYLP